MKSPSNQITAGLERLPYKQEVRGSSPRAPTKESITCEPSGSLDPPPGTISRSPSVTYLCPDHGRMFEHWEWCARERARRFARAVAALMLLATIATASPLISDGDEIASIGTVQVITPHTLPERKI